jgi:uncharacterized protein YkwD
MKNFFHKMAQDKQSLISVNNPFQENHSQPFHFTRSTPSLRRSSFNYISGDGLNRKEEKLAQLVNQYRQRNNLPNIRLSKALTTVANRHVLDLAANGINGSLHSWSNAPFDSRDSKTYPSMWLAPKRLKTRYPGYGYENAYARFDRNATPQSAFNAWKNSPLHNALMINQGSWRSRRWKAMGVGLHQGFAVLWFGEESDPTGKPTQ